jgi:holo-[acyl-carrier protein] synthase
MCTRTFYSSTNMTSEAACRRARAFVTLNLPMILGTGVDLCEVARIAKAIQSPHGQRLIERVFTEREIAYAQRKARPFERYAARFAAKEAGMKALGTGWRNGVAWRDFEVANLPSGRPTLKLHGRAAEIAQKLGVTNIALSITHTSEQAMAMVILES